MPAYATLERQRQEIIQRHDLVYMEDSEPGLSRRKRGRGFEYFTADGTKVVCPTKLAWLNQLVLPPAWEDVWITPIEHAHLLATGRDAKRRKQYRYHDAWISARKQALFDQLPKFAEALPTLREQIDADMRRTKMSYERVVAASIYLLDLTNLRVGNTIYSKQGHYGLTTLKDQHVDANTSGFSLDFIGKSGKNIQMKVSDDRAARFMRRCQELPGQQLLQYRDDGAEGNAKLRSIGSSDINDYLQCHAGPFTAKDFRTWAGSLAAIESLAKEPALDDIETESQERQYKQACVTAVKTAAKQLHNTPATAKAHYITPLVFEAYEQGHIADIWSRYRNAKQYMSLSETRLLVLLDG